MIQAIIQNNNTGQTAITDLPQSRMNMAGMLASIGIRQPAYEIHCHDDEEGGIQVKLNGRDRFEAQVVATVRETDILISPAVILIPCETLGLIGTICCSPLRISSRIMRSFR